MTKNTGLDDRRYKMNLSDVAAKSFQAGLDARTWPKNMAEYHAQWRERGDEYKQSPGAIAFRIYSQAAVKMGGESEQLRDAIYLGVLGEIGRNGLGL
jgi:hypothetical protein